MLTLLFIRKNLALGQKTEGDSSRWGTGSNFKVEVGFEWNERFDEGQARESLNSVLSEIDHFALGVDRWKDKDPSTANICEWILTNLKNRGAREVRLIRGDGLSATSRNLK